MSLQILEYLLDVDSVTECVLILIVET